MAHARAGCRVDHEKNADVCSLGVPPMPRRTPFATWVQTRGEASKGAFGALGIPVRID
jgi:hypothetical protein